MILELYTIINKYISLYEYESETLSKAISKALSFEKTNIVKITC